MRLPAPLYRRNPNAHKNDFGHILILAGSRNMAGAAALTSLAAMRSGTGLVTVGIPKSLNGVIQKKIPSVVMTLPLPETPQQSLAVAASKPIQDFKHDVLALGPGLSQHASTQKLILKVIATSTKPMVIDADALNALANDLGTLQKKKTTAVLTPHVGEMARLTKLKKEFIERNRLKLAQEFAQRYKCILVLKGAHTVVASPDGENYLNKTGNAGMATAGSGDVLTGMIASLLGQGLNGFEAAKCAVFIHGKAGDLAAKTKTRISLIATDIIEKIPAAFAAQLR